jgi:hypothetical protein
MVSKVVNKPPLSIEIDEDGNVTRKGGKSIIYKPDNKGSALMQNYSTQVKPAGTKVGKSPIAL